MAGLIRPATLNRVLMNYKILVARCLFAAFVLHTVAACGDSKNIIDQSQKKGMTAAERKDKRGE